MVESLPHEEEAFCRMIGKGARLKTFLSMSAYSLGKTIGIEAASHALHEQFRAPDAASLPGIRTLRRLAHLSEAQVQTDTGSSHIGKTRSRQFHAAREADADAWISVDDDVEISQVTALYLLQALNDYEPRIVVVPTYMRAAAGARPTISIKPLKVLAERHVGQAHLVACESGAFGCVGMNRAAMSALVIEATATGQLSFIDVDGVAKLALFHEMIADDVDGKRRWYGEDLAFFRRVPRFVTVEALLAGHSKHAGALLDLENEAHFALVP